MILFYVRMVRPRKSLVISRDGSLLVHYYCYNSRLAPRFHANISKAGQLGGKFDRNRCNYGSRNTAKSEKKLERS